MLPVLLRNGSTLQVKCGCILHSDIIGTPFGGRTYTTNKKGWATILHPTPELWTITLPHRTQILYSTDISLITVYLQLKPGSVVCESGTGSGSLSHAIARTIAPSGILHTYEFHKERADIAKKEFRNHNLSNVIVNHCDVCKSGFGLDDVCDAVFLDLPQPWEAIPYAKTSLKRFGGRFCSFSPCIEQVQQTCVVLDAFKFTDIQTIECLCKPYDVHPCIVNYPGTSNDEMGGDQNSTTIYTCLPHRNIPGHTGFLTFATLL